MRGGLIILHAIFLAYIFGESEAFLSSAHLKSTVPEVHKTRSTALHMIEATQDPCKFSRRAFFASITIAPSFVLLSSIGVDAKEVINDCEPW